MVTDLPVFRPFNPDGPLRIYVRNLPHWRQAGATYFVTFRQDDSIPQSVLAEWMDIRNRWLARHNIDLGWKQTAPERFTLAYQSIPPSIRRAFERKQAKLLHEELDRCHGSCVLRRAEPQRIVSDSLAFFNGNRLWLGDSVIMPNHVHAIVQPFAGFELEQLLGSIKKWTARLIGAWLNVHSMPIAPSVHAHNRSRFWQQESYDRIVRDADELNAYRRYIAQNPDTAGLRAGEFVLHQANWLDLYADRPPYNFRVP